MTTEGAWTVLKLLGWTKDHFAKAQIESPRLCAEILLAQALGLKRIELYTRYDYQPTPDELTRFRDWVKRAAAREPVAYLVGEKEFYSLRFKVTPDVLIPRPETELLVGEAISHLRSLGRPGKLWDICTGSGCVAIATAVQVKDVQVLASDLSEPAVAVATENALAHHLADRLECRVANLLALPGDCRLSPPFDVITANPPYVADADPVAPEVQREPVMALRGGKTGLDLIELIVRDAPPLLCPGGVLIMEFGFDQADAVRNLIVATGQFAEPRILRDHQHIERAATAKKK